MNKGFTALLPIIIIAIIFAAGIFFVVNKVAEQTQDKPIKGVSLSPKSYEENDFLEFLDKSKEAGSLISWAGNAKELKSQDGAPYVVANIAKQQGLTLAVFTLPPNTQDIIDFTEQEKPSYLAIGVEINILTEEELNKLIEEFPKIYEGVKQVSPDTKVFVGYQLENLKGLNGGLFGGTNDETQSQWDLLDSFPQADLVAFTTYPFLIYKDPSEIPDNYYQEIANKTDKPIAFVEIGWPSITPAPGWETNQEEQAEFVNHFFQLTSDLNTNLFIWPFLYDQTQVQDPFKFIGLFDENGEEKEAWQAWLQN